MPTPASDFDYARWLPDLPDSKAAKGEITSRNRGAVAVKPTAGARVKRMNETKKEFLKLRR